ncbi:MAG: nickel pincer cofactor biosynthesis protein LarC [Clostridiales bacterium]|nr:nickel pincer cofactor biosynthesis protein LarC [Clostridiales bacterium]
MKTMYIECNMGAAGDMLTAALLELCPKPEAMIDKLNMLNIPNVTYRLDRTVRRGITGTHVTVSVNGAVENGNMHHHKHIHVGLHDIEHIINTINVPRKVREDAAAVYKLIAEAESRVHGCKMTEIHFHEVGTMDAVADIVGVCMLMNEINPEKVIVSPIHVGSGTVRCAHGELPVPAPATALILRDVPVYGGSIRGELCTPTGAALLKYFADSFGEMPVMRVRSIGYGMGTKDFETANCVRILLGEAEDKTDKIIELKCNLDDMTGEAIGFAAGRLFDAGALDVYTVPIGMKKSRPGILLTCMCREEDRERMLEIIFRHTTTIGIREYICSRYVLDKKIKKISSNYGEIRVKESCGRGIKKIKAEYDDLEEAAIRNNISLTDIKLDL